MANKPQFSQQKFLDAIPNSAGIVSTIAARVGCDWHTAKKYIENHPTIKRAYDDERERLLDMTEGKLMTLIKEGDFSAIKYYLSTIGKRRGYVERQETTGADGAPLVIRIIEK